MNPARTGTKMAAHYAIDIPAGESWSVRLRFSNRKRRRNGESAEKIFGAACDGAFAARIEDADEFYGQRCGSTLSPRRATRAAAGIRRPYLGQTSVITTT